MKQLAGIFGGVLIVVFAVLANNSKAQTVFKGKVIEEGTVTGIPGVHVTLLKHYEGEPGEKIEHGTTTDENGLFSIKLISGQISLVFSSLNHEEKRISLNIEDKEGDLEETVALKKLAIRLDEVNIIASIVKDRNTPVSVSNINIEQIERELGDQPFPQVMKMVPGAFPSRNGGGSGDATLNLRGFKQENIAIHLNGVPVNSVENGLVYWNNWTGLGDVTNSIQVQKGLGNTKVAMNSIGGTVNIITKSTESEKGGVFHSAITDYGNYKLSLALNSGRMKNGMSVSVMVSRTAGPGYIDATPVNAMGYFLSISKEFGRKHKLVLTAIGAPERHGQRQTKFTKSDYEKYGHKYSFDWGYMNGEEKIATENFYHKPYITLNHYWQLTDRSFLSTSAYITPGSGGGTWSDSYPTWVTPSLFEFRTSDNLIDWDSVYHMNQTHTDTAVLDNGEKVNAYSKVIQTDYLASHIWTGIISKLDHKLSDDFNFTAGIHYRYFKSHLRQEITDLLGGSFYIDDYSWSLSGVSGRQQIKHVGDIIKVNNYSYLNYISGFAQITMDKGNLTGFLAGGINYNSYQREDPYNYIENTKSESVNRTGYDVKGGLNYNFNEHSNAYVNGGYFSRVPYYKFIFGNFNNDPLTQLENEQVSSFEFGYIYNNRSTIVKVNLYSTSWKNKSFLRNLYNQTETLTMTVGQNSLHNGIELEASRKLMPNMKLGVLAALGEWKWKNNVQANVYDNNQTVKDTVTVYADGLYVGGAPQTQIGLFWKYHFLDKMDVNLNWIYYDRLYADFDPESRTDKQDKNQSYRVPSYHIMDLHISYSETIGKNTLIIYGSANNILDSKHIEQAVDGPTHSQDDVRGFWSFGRTFNLGVRFLF